jgi:PAS domain S-box-containing protein
MSGRTETVDDGFSFNFFKVDDEAVAAELRINQSVHVLRSMPVLLFGNIGAVLIITYLDWQAVTESNALYLLLLQLLLMVPLVRSFLKLRRLPRPQRVSKRRIRMLELYTLVMGVTWAGTGVLLFPVLNEIDSIVAMMVLMFLCFGAVALTPSLPRVAMAYFVPILLGLAVGGFRDRVLEPDVLAILLLSSAPAVIKTVMQNFEDIVGYVGINLERLAAEVELRHQQSREAETMRAMVEAIPIPLVVTRHSGTFEFNQTAADQFGVAAGEVTGVNVRDYYVNPDDQRRLTRIQNQFGRLEGVEVQFKDSAGNPFWALISSRPLDYHGEDCWLSAIYVIEARKRAEQALEESRELLQALADNIPEYITFKDMGGRYRFINKCFEDWTLFKREDIIGMTVEDIYDAETARDIGALDRECLDDQKVIAREVDSTYPDGKTRTVMSIRFPVIGAGGRKLGLGTVNHDLTARKEIEQQLLKQSRVHQQTLDNMGQGLTMYDGEWNLVAYNQRYAEHFDLPDDVLRPDVTFDDVVGATMKQDYGDEWRDRLGVVRDPNRMTGIWRRKFRRPSGRGLDLLSVPVPGGGFIVTSTDMTALMDAEEKLREILESSPIGIVVASKKDGRRLFVNQALTEMMGVGFDAADDTAGNAASLETWVDPARLQDIYDVIREGKVLKAAEAERVRPDGSHWWVLLNSQPTIFEGEEAVVIWQVDITERKRFEVEIRGARDRAEATLRDLEATQEALMHQEKMASLGQLTAGIAHELKNPLNFINNFALGCDELLAELRQILERGDGSVAAQEQDDFDDIIRILSDSLGKIALHGGRADSIIRSMLDHSRGSKGVFKNVEVNVIVDEALTLAYHGARALDSTFNVSLHTDYDENAGKAAMVPQEISRVLLNLIGNAFYATREREEADGDYVPEVRIGTERRGDEIDIFVRDNGTGMDRETRDKLFTPFFTTKPPGEGTGLGLSLSYDIVAHQHGGTISIDSEKGKFTEVHVRLPVTNRGMMSDEPGGTPS